MNAELLIRSFVKEIAGLIADVATSGGHRVPVGGVMNQVFLSIADELEARGVSRKVAADMFGMDLRAYIRKLHRSRASVTVRGRTLWEAIYSLLADGAVKKRKEIVDQFEKDPEALVRSVLYDLTESGLVFSSGTGDQTAFRVAGDNELSDLRTARSDAADEIVWSLLFRLGSLTREELMNRVHPCMADVGDALGRLAETGRVQCEVVGGVEQYSASSFLIPLGSATGREAALIDHFHAVIETMRQRLEASAATEAEASGGSTYVFQVWEGHPHEAEIRTALSRSREHYSALRARVLEHNASSTHRGSTNVVTIYFGQYVEERKGNR